MKNQRRHSFLDHSNIIDSSLYDHCFYTMSLKSSKGETKKKIVQYFLKANCFYTKKQFLVFIIVRTILVILIHSNFKYPSRACKIIRGEFCFPTFKTISSNVFLIMEIAHYFTLLFLSFFNGVMTFM